MSSFSALRRVEFQVFSEIAKGKHGLLLMVLLIRHVGNPLTELESIGIWVSLLLIAAVQVVGVRSVLREDKRLAGFFGGVLIVSLALLLTSFLVSGTVLVYAALVGFALFEAELIRVILIDVMRPARVDVDRIMGALAAYMLIASLWTLYYVFVQGVAPNSFDLGPYPDQVLVVDATTGVETWQWPEDKQEEHRILAPLDDLSYFSVVTLTTLGYGDIVPKGNWVRPMATLEALVGAIYLAVLLARLVSMNVSQSAHWPPDEANDDVAGD